MLLCRLEFGYESEVDAFFLSLLTEASLTKNFVLSGECISKSAQCERSSLLYCRTMARILYGFGGEILLPETNAKMTVGSLG